ncbi:PREDICTED: RPM1-interacting protein 4-like isoform X2 [Tarenaya hassleriana]|uniref:RPM1-interacting protein 4-like isoform X2 n=1 Tax=Tarenaya hassleriana TaxID=28532 RepID=UPI00053C2AE6|nr:PREDICTED: RPM1-interacting protein 4-like isoform X2 [Tarenaya hassleriana]
MVSGFLSQITRHEKHAFVIKTHKPFRLQKRPNVPKFGDWQNDTPFSVVFENARKKKNPHDPKGNPELPSNQGSPSRHPRTPNPTRHEPPKQILKQGSNGFRQNRGGEEFRRFAPSPAQSDKNSTRVRTQVPPRESHNNNRPYGGGNINQAETNRRPPPPQNPRPIANVRGQQYRAPAIPPFPGKGSNSENYTHIFEQVRVDRHQEGGRTSVGSTPTHPINHHPHSSPPNISPKSCCFPWSRKGKY